MAFALSRRWLVAVCAVVFAAAVGNAAHGQKVFLWSLETGNVPDIAKAAEWIGGHVDSRDAIVTSLIPSPSLQYLLIQRWPGLEACLNATPSPRRIVAVIAKQPGVDDGHATNPWSWHLEESTPSKLMFGPYRRELYSQPQVVENLAGLTIWEAWRTAADDSGSAHLATRSSPASPIGSPSRVLPPSGTSPPPPAKPRSIESKSPPSAPSPATPPARWASQSRWKPRRSLSMG